MPNKWYANKIYEQLRRVHKNDLQTLFYEHEKTMSEIQRLSFETLLNVFYLTEHEFCVDIEYGRVENELANLKARLAMPLDNQMALEYERDLVSKLEHINSLMYEALREAQTSLGHGGVGVCACETCEIIHKALSAAEGRE